MAQPTVRLIVLNYNGGALVERCLDHLEALDWPADRLQLVVVDNASHDGSDRRLEERSRVRVIRSPTNVGFPGNNLAMRDLDAVDFVGLINNDAFVEPDFLAPLVSALADDAGLGAACPKILLADRFADLVVQAPPWHAPNDGRELGVRISGVRVDGVDRWRSVGFRHGVYEPEAGDDAEGEFRWTAGRAEMRVPVSAADPGSGSCVHVRLAATRPTTVSLQLGGAPVAVEVGTDPSWFEVSPVARTFDVINNAGSILVEGGYGADRGFLERDRGQYDESDEVFAWCGGAVLFRRQYLQQVGLLDPSFFMYYEDTDMGWRGRAQGWRYRYEPRSVVRHVHAATSVEGSSMFHHYVERNRLAMLTKNAPARFALGAVVRFLLSTLSYARRDILRPALRGRRPRFGLVWARLSSFRAYLAMTPRLLTERRSLRRCQVVSDAEILAWAVPQPDPD